MVTLEEQNKKFQRNIYNWKLHKAARARVCLEVNLSIISPWNWLKDKCGRLAFIDKKITLVCFCIACCEYVLNPWLEFQVCVKYDIISTSVLCASLGDPPQSILYPSHLFYSTTMLHPSYETNFSGTSCAFTCPWPAQVSSGERKFHSKNWWSNWLENELNIQSAEHLKKKKIFEGKKNLLKNIIFLHIILFENIWNPSQILKVQTAVPQETLLVRDKNRLKQVDILSYLILSYLILSRSTWSYLVENVHWKSSWRCCTL